jgi:segregation and condensation protein B
MADNVKAVMEALLFASEAPLTLEQFKNVLSGFETDQIRDKLRELNDDYLSGSRGLRIIEVAGGFRLITPPELSPFLKKLYKQKRAERLSRPALETLAIVAYKQPVTRMEIESLRNVNIDGMVSGLLEKGFIRVAGVKKAPGRPRVYGTTKQFLEYFGLKSLEELPKLEDFAKLNTRVEAEVKDAPREPAPEN